MNKLVNNEPLGLIVAFGLLVIASCLSFFEQDDRPVLVMFLTYLLCQKKLADQPFYRRILQIETMLLALVFIVSQVLA